MALDRIYTTAESVRSAWDDLFIRVRNQWDKFDASMNAMQGLSALDLDRSFRVALELLLNTRSDESQQLENPILVIRQFDIIGALQAVENALRPWADQYKSQWRESTRVVSVDGQFQWGLEDGGARYNEVNVQGLFTGLSSAVTSLMTIVGQVVPLCRGGSIHELGERSNALANLLSEIQPLFGQAKSQVNRATTAVKRIEEKGGEVDALAQQAASDLTRLRELLKAVNSDHGQVTAQADRVQQILNTAETLSQTVSQYQAKFDEFKSTLDERQKSFIEFDSRARDADKRNEGYEKTIKGLIEQSNEMLAGATTVGLAKAMEDTRSRYEERMKSTRRGFYFSVALLVVSALPLAIHLIPGLIELLPWFSGKDGKPLPTINPTADGSPYAVVGKVILLLPATWLTAFFTKTYANLFQLEREYAHKAALAGSVHGFRLQAPKYEEEITAEVFMEVRLNPANGPGVEAASHPLYDVLAKVVKGVLSRGAEEKQG